jgi:hypothetical protein
MSQGQKWAAVLIVLACLALAGVTWAGSADGTAVDWQVLSGGGAPAVSGSGHVALNGSLGQTAIGYSSTSHGALDAGFWYGVGEGKFQIYLPLVLRQYSSFSDPYEPNDSFDQAWGPLVSGQTYSAFFPTEADADDWYYFNLGATHSIELWLTNIPCPDNDYDLYLYDAAMERIGYSGEHGCANEHIYVGNRSAGKYYVRIRRGQGTSQTQPYALRVVYQ